MPSAVFRERFPKLRLLIDRIIRVYVRPGRYMIRVRSVHFALGGLRDPERRVCGQRKKETKGEMEEGAGSFVFQLRATTFGRFRR